MKRMAQTSVIVVSLAVLGTLSGLAYVHANREDAASPEMTSTAVAARTHVEAPPAPSVSTQKETPAQETSTRQIASADVERWIVDTQSNDAKTRAAAIAALANAPKARAMPALERVLESGEPQVDRQIALQSLHMLALNDGDENGRIRDAIRHAIYHSDDEGVTQSAQAFLEDIEAALAE
jgi:HEAT repeat protein